MLLSSYLPPLYPEMLTIVASELLKLWAIVFFLRQRKAPNTAQAISWNHTFQHSSYSSFRSKYEVVSMQGTPKSVFSTATLNFQMDCVLPQVFWCLDVPLHLSFPSKIEWDLTNGPLSKLLELLDTQVGGSVQWVLLRFLGSFYRHVCWGVQDPRSHIKASLVLLCFLGGVTGIFAVIGQVFGKAVVTDRVGVDLGCLGLDCRFLCIYIYLIFIYMYVEERDIW